MTSIATDENNDIYVTATGNLAMVTGLDAVEQDCEHVMKAQLGEMPLALDRGEPSLTCIWINYKPLQWQAAARKNLLTITGVVSIAGFTITRQNGVASYTAQIKTIYSEIPINLAGNLVQ